MPGFHRQFLIVCLATCSACAAASEAWDGAWFLDRAASQGATGIVLSWSKHDAWHFFDGYEDRSFIPDGRIHRAKTSAIEHRASSPDPLHLFMAEGIHGREYESYAFSLSPDLQTLTCTLMRLRWDGQPRTRSIVYQRSSRGTTLQGSWKETEPRPTQKQPTVPTTAAPPPQPAWVIWKGSDGVMTWFIPSTGEMLRGKADRVWRRIEGPYYDGMMFKWTRKTPHQLDFVAYSDGKPQEYAIETISPDGQTLTDTLWAPGHQDSKVISTFRRHP